MKARLEIHQATRVLQWAYSRKVQEIELTV